MSAAKLIGWFRSRSRAVRYFLVGFFVPLSWSILMGFPGLVLGIEKADSLGAGLIAMALFVHLPTILVLGRIGLLPSVGMGDSDAALLVTLAVVTLPSCLFYGFIGWLFAKTIEMKDAI